MRHVRAGLRRYRLRRNGRFAVLNVGLTKAAVHQGLGLSLRIDHYPLEDESHAGIHGYTPDDLAVAVELKALLSTGAVHPAVP